MATVKVILREDKLNTKTGEAPLYLRIIKDRKSKFISLGIKVKPKYWNKEKMSVRKGATNYHEINSFLISKRSEAEKTSIELEGTSKGTTTKKIKDRIVGKKQKDFFEYSDQKLAKLKYTVATSTYNTYRFYLGKIENFLGYRTISFQDMDIDFIKEYENYLYSELGNKPTTVDYSFKVIKIMFNYAIAEGVIDNNTYPFRGYKFKKQKTCLLYTSPSPRDVEESRMPSSA